MSAGKTRYALTEKERAFVVAMMKSKGDKAVFERWVRRKKAGNAKSKGDPYILVVGHYRIVTVKKSVTGAKNVHREYHFYDVKELSCTVHQTAKFVYRDGFSFLFETDKAIDAVLAFTKNLARITVDFPSTSLPVMNLTDQYSTLIKSKAVDHEAEAGSIIPIYCAHSYHLKKYPSNALAEYIKEQFASGRVDLSLTEVFHIHPKGPQADIVPLMRAMKYNKYFTEMEITHIQRRDVLQLMTIALETNDILTDIAVIGLQDPKNGFAELATAIASNPASKITSLDFSYTRICKSLGTSAAQQLANAIKGLPQGLVSLRLTNCEISSKGMAMILGSLRTSAATQRSLQVLSLSGNEIGHSKDNIRMVSEVLKPLKHLVTLELKNTDIDLMSAVNALVAGPTETLEVLDIGGNKINSVQLSAVVSKFVSFCHALSWLGMSNTKLTGEIFEGIVASVGTNKRLQSRYVMVDVSSNDLGAKKADAAALVRAISNTKNLNGLDLRDSKFKAKDLASIIAAFENGMVRRVELGALKRSNAKVAISTMVDTGAIGVGGGTLEYLTMPGDAKRTYGDLLLPLIGVLDRNLSLVHLDISFNLIGANGMHSLVRSLRSNCTLLALICDDNGANLDVWQELRDCLNMNNRTLCHIDFPKIDIGKASSKSKENADRIASIWEGIMARLQQNHDALAESAAYQKLVRYESSGLQSAAEEPSHPGGVTAEDSHDTVVGGERTAAFDIPSHVEAAAPVHIVEEPAQDEQFAHVEQFDPLPEVPAVAVSEAAGPAPSRLAPSRPAPRRAGGRIGNRPGSRISFRPNERRSVMMTPGTNLKSLIAEVAREQQMQRKEEDALEQFEDGDSSAASEEARSYEHAAEQADASADCFDSFALEQSGEAEQAAEEEEVFTDEDEDMVAVDDDEDDEYEYVDESAQQPQEAATSAERAPQEEEEVELVDESLLTPEQIQKQREYQEYLRKKAEYDEYLRKKAEYEEYLRKKEEYERQLKALEGDPSAEEGATALEGEGSDGGGATAAPPAEGPGSGAQRGGAARGRGGRGRGRGGFNTMRGRGRGGPRGRGRAAPRGRGAQPPQVGQSISQQEVRRPSPSGMRRAAPTRNDSVEGSASSNEIRRTAPRRT